MKRFNQYSDETKVAYFDQINGKMSGDTVNITGAASGSATFDGSGELNIETTLATLPYPDLHVPFNDGARIESGYGTNDQIDVSASQDGSVMVDLPSMSADFTCSTGRYFINKSGLIDYADVDEPCITSDGVLMHESYTSLFTYSNDISNSSWINTRVTVEDDGTLAPFATELSATTAYHLVNSTESGAHRISSTVPRTADEYTTVWAVVKPDTGYESVRLELQNYDSPKTTVYNTYDGTVSLPASEPDDYGIKELSDGWFLIWSRWLNDPETENTTVKENYLYFLPSGTASNSFTGDGVNGGYVAYYQCANSWVPEDLLLATNGSGSTTAIANCLIPAEKNITLGNGDFSVVFDFNYSQNDVDPTTILSSGVATPSNTSLGIYVNQSSALRLRDLSGAVTTSVAIPEGLSRWSYTYNDDTKLVSVYIDGSLIYSYTTTQSPLDSDSDNFILGRDAVGSAYRARGGIKNFRAYNSTLTAGQIKALGAAE
jgi:hypothetical protein